MSVLADWLVRQAPSALHRGDLRPEQRRALHAIRRCRTPASGGQRYRCAHCGGEHHGYHSCHHRACPRCGGGKTAAWTQQQVERLLPVPYFFVTCTVPEQLHGAFAARPEVVHDILFTAAAAALQSVAAILASVAGVDDLACRLGGDEFCLLVSARDQAEVMRYAQFVVESADKLLQLRQAVPGICPVSVGACLVEPGQDWNDWYARADAALYEAKRQGGGRACWSDGVALLDA